MNLKAGLDIVAYIVVIALGVYQIYKSVKRLTTHLNGRKEFLESNKYELKEEFLEHMTWVIIYGVTAVAVFALGVYRFIFAKDYLMTCACVALAAILAGYVLDCFVTRRSWYYEDGFFFENKYYKYRSLAAIEKRKGIFPAYDVRFHANPDMVVTKKMGEKLMDKQAEWKRIKKEKKAGNK